MTKNSQKFKHVPTLDGIRGIAILVVMLSHCTYGYFPGGFVGVDLFFVLSGYLITSLLLTEFATCNSISFSNFYVRRVLRLLPPMLVGVAIIYLLWERLGGPTSNKNLATIASFFYFANVIPMDKIGLFGHFWSLSVEEHFYFLWPAIVAFFLVKVTLRTRILSLGFAILCLVLFRRVAYASQWEIVPGFLVINPWEFTFCRIDSILMGGMLAILVPQINQSDKVIVSKITGKRWAFISLLLFVGLGPIIDKGHSYMFTWGFLSVDLFCSYLVFSAVSCTNSVFSNGLLRWVGQRSYGIYIYHVPIFSLLEPFRINHSPTNLAIVTLLRFGITFLAAEISYRFMELPILAYKRKFQTQSKVEAVMPSHM